MSESLIQVEREASIVTLVLHNPQRRNAMSQAMGEAFAARVAELVRDASVRAVILTGSEAGRAFCAGGDLGMIGGRAQQGSDNPTAGRAAARDAMRGFYGLFLSIRDLPCPTVAALNGAAIGAGLCIAMACDLRVAARDARLALNFAQLGIHPGMGATWTLPRLVGPAVAADLLYTGRAVSGTEAQRIGLVNRAVPGHRVAGEARSLAGELAASAPLAVRGAKRALARSHAASLEAQLDFEAERQAECFETADLREGLTAVRERRAPRFRGA